MQALHYCYLQILNRRHPARWTPSTSPRLATTAWSRYTPDVAW